MTASVLVAVDQFRN